MDSRRAPGGIGLKNHPKSQKFPLKQQGRLNSDRDVPVLQHGYNHGMYHIRFHSHTIIVSRALTLKEVRPPPAR